MTVAETGKSELVPKNDIIFKNLFSKIGNEDMLKELLEEIIKIKIKEIEVQKEVELSKMKKEEKYGKLDLRVIINKNAIVIIEMQMENNCDMEKRAMYYASKIVGSSLCIGETYDKIKDIYVISILNYEMTRLNKYCSDTVTVENEYRNYEMIKGIKYFFIELPKFRKQIQVPETKLEQWLAFIDYENKELINMAIEKNELVKKAQRDYEYLTGDAATRRLQELREKAILDENSAYATGIKRGKKEGERIGEARGEARGEKRGIKIGEARGKREGKIEIAMAMLKNNVNRDIIEKCTGLNDEELDKICT